MAKLQTSLDISIPFRPQPSPDTSTGQVEMWSEIANSTARLTQTLSKMADERAAQEGNLAGIMAGSEAALPAGVKATPTEQKGQGAASHTQLSGLPAAAAGAVGEDYYDRLSDIESGGNDNAFNPHSKAAGRYQFIPSTARAYGLKNPRDRKAARIAVGQLTADNRAALIKALGREPTKGELYLAHQQGAGGAIKLLRNPGAAATSVVGLKAVTLNGGTASMTAGQFANLWISKFENRPARNTAPVPPPAAVPPTVASVPAAAEAVAGPAAILTATPPGDGAPFRLTHSFTIRGQAYDKATMETYSNRLESKIYGDLEAIASATPDAPEQIDAAFDQYKEQQIAGIAQQDAKTATLLRPGIEATVERQKIAYMRQASEQHLKNVQQQADAQFLTTYADKRRNVIQLAARAGTDEQGNAVLQAELSHMEDFVAGAQNLTPVERVKLQAELTDDVTTARVLGAFENAATPEQRRAFASVMDENWQAGKIKDMSPEAFARVQSQMQQVLARDETQALKASVATERLVNDALDRVKDGIAIPEAERSQLKSQVAQSPDPEVAAKWNFMERMANWQAANRAQPPEVLAAQIHAAETAMAKDGASAEGRATLAMMKGLYKSMTDGLDKDQLGWAEQVGRVQLSPVDFTNGDTLKATLQERADDARAVGKAYGRDPVFFRPDERDKLSKALLETPDLLAGIGPAFRRALGNDTPRALGELSKDAPVLAHVSGLTDSTGDEGFLRDTVSALKLRKIDNYEPVQFPRELRPPVAAFAFMPNVEAAATKAAELVFDVRARAAGIDPKSEAGTQLWGTVMSEAVGGHMVKGEMHGGLAEVNGATTIIPPDMTADEVTRRMDNLNDGTLLMLPPINSSNGIAISADRIKRGRLVPAAGGQYYVALGDPQGSDPQFIMGADGKLWTLDLNSLSIGGGGGW